MQNSTTYIRARSVGVIAFIALKGNGKTLRKPNL